MGLARLELEPLQVAEAARVPEHAARVVGDGGVGATHRERAIAGAFGEQRVRAAILGMRGYGAARHGADQRKERGPPWRGHAHARRGFPGVRCRNTGFHQVGYRPATAPA
jgi:hypothetical protein